MSSVPKHRPIPHEEQLVFWQRWKNGDAAAGGRIMESYEGFIHKFLKKTYGARVAGQDYDDALSAARIGFYRALEKFDPSKQVQIGTYAVFWMRAEVDDMLRLLHDGARRNNKALAVSREVSAELAKSSSHGKTLGETFERVSERLSLPVESVRYQFEKANRKKIPLDARLGDDENSATVGDMIAEDMPHPTEAIARRESNHALYRAIDQLEPRLKKIVCLRFGIASGENGATLEEVGQEFGISKERVRQLEIKAIETLRQHIDSAHRPGQ